jgi:N-methylhydantoinase A
LAKIPTTAANQADGVLAAIAEAGIAAADLDLIIHGTTTTTNAVLERKVAKVGLITTRGFRDILELGRRTRPQPYGMVGTFEPLIPRERRLEIDERISARGEIIVALAEAQLADAVQALIAAGCECLLIHFLHSYANPAHELRAGEIARSLWPNAYVTLGHALLAEFREYERGTTASVNAAVQPILDRYLRRLQAELKGRGFARDLLVMNGNGGTVAARLVAREAAKTIMSGPASGVMAAAATLAQCGVSNAISYDMGGTSTDVALIRGGAPHVSSELSIDYGLPIHLPMVDVRSIGAGGGSIASVDAAGMLHVGPQSAGSEPGPICYGRGGSAPTITDANLMLGRLDPGQLSAAPARATLDRVRAIFQSRLAEPLGIGVEAAAAAVIRLANTRMAGAVRMVSIARGHDPRDFALFAFGGAGPMHAVALARDCLVADLRQDFVNTLNVPLDAADMGRVQAILAAQRRRGMAMNAEEQDEIVETVVLHGADMQFRGQTHLLRVALPNGEVSRATLQALFERAYFARFQVELPEIKAMLVNLVTSVIGRRRAFPLSALIEGRERADSGEQACIGERSMFADARWHRVRVYDRMRLPPAARVAGPALIQQMDATTVVEPEAVAVVDATGNLRIAVTGPA